MYSISLNPEQKNTKQQVVRLRSPAPKKAGGLSPWPHNQGLKRSTFILLTQGGNPASEKFMDTSLRLRTLRTVLRPLEAAGCGKTLIYAQGHRTSQLAPRKAQGYEPSC